MNININTCVKEYLWGSLVIAILTLVFLSIKKRNFVVVNIKTHKITQVMLIHKRIKNIYPKKLKEVQWDRNYQYIF